MSRGYTVVEVILVVGILAIVARLGLPVLHHQWLRAEARDAVEAIRAVEAAARQAYSESGAGALRGEVPGQVPEGLAPFLDGGVRFQASGYRLGWRHWRFGEELQEMVEGSGVGTLTVEIPDPDLQDAFLSLAYPSLWYRTGDTFAFLLPEL